MLLRLITYQIAEHGYGVLPIRNLINAFEGAIVSYLSI